MARNDQTRREPTLADLEAFEKLLRESLHGERVAAPAPPADQPATPPAHAAPARGADAAAMAELARLVETPVDFQVPAPLASRRTAPAEPAPVTMHGAARAELTPGWTPEPQVAAHFHDSSAPTAAPAAALEAVDPLAAFEEELRRFDAMRASEDAARRGAPADAAPMPRNGNPAHSGAAYADSTHADGAHPAPEDAQAAYAVPGSGQAAPSPLTLAEERIAAEAAAAAAAAGGRGGVRRSRGIFLALGGLAVAGLAVIGGSMVFGSKRAPTGPGGVPVIAARPEPTKERPAEPGGLEIPDQNKQVLAPRGTTSETRPSQVVTTTEQPLDLNQVTRRESVRIVAPSPYQNAGAAAPSSAAAQAEGASAAASVEARRVSSVRIPVGGGEPAPAPGPAAGGETSRSAVPSFAAGAETPAQAPASAPSAPVPPVPPAKVESRPTTASGPSRESPVPRTETPRATPPARVAAAPAPARPAREPLPLTPPRAAEEGETPAANAGAATGNFAIQLASRPSEADARTAGNQLRGRYAAILGGRNPNVVTGEANGQTVYRVRVGGYSQAAANEACRRIKAAGGGCFVTRQ
ncbi:SPOR domain-containing protein [Rhabdaerophilum calidifontis]|uniref:SPOR domain-containing protein n=1 Tax=Rhabdaerophilum calidifontis TaxID=2604328 RepID=UPI001408CB96|nr:SPOR domain-containing protein [Rhabdaerophilum calidifontis]